MRDSIPSADSVALAREADDLCREFADALRRGEPIRLGDRLPPSGPLREATLPELVRIELEHRLRAGELARAEEYLARYPELAEDPDGAARLRALEQRIGPHAPDPTKLEDASAPLISTGIGLPPIPESSPPGDAGLSGMRYVPVRLHAKGGLGEIHLAEDTELRRRVALKRIQGVWAGHAESRRRFLREAEVTAQLEHPGVVPVHGLVQDSDGEPCYAMRFIEGETLQDALRRFHEQKERDAGERGLELRQLLQRFVAVCNTIAYAHSKGVVHRDLKPANVMLGHYGETIVVDWGLAKVTASEETVSAESSEAETLAGAVIGTPAYMSPEQAAGRIDQVGSASDVYSLGATLYEVLCGEVPYKGTAAEVVGAVQKGDFSPPRKHNPETPPPLEAICLRAMALRPQDRYGSALDLAADVERWLAGEAVSAYRESLAERLTRTARRHRTVVRVTAGFFVALTVFLIAGLFALGAKQKQTDEARQQAELHADDARQSLEDVFEAVDQMLVQIGGDRMAGMANVEPARRAMLEEAVKIYRRVLERNPTHPEALARVGYAELRTGMIYRWLSQQANAVVHLNEAVAIFTKLSAQRPENADYRERLANSHFELGLIRQFAGNYTEASRHYRQALTLFVGLPSEDPKILVPHGHILVWLGGLDEVAGRFPEAERQYRDAEQLLRRAVQDHPESKVGKVELAHSLRAVASLMGKQERNEDAERYFREAIALVRPMADAKPRDNVAAFYLEQFYSDFASHLAKTPTKARRKEAEEAYRASIRLLEAMIADAPTVPHYRNNLALSQGNLALYLLRQGRAEEADVLVKNALDTQYAVTEEVRSLPGVRDTLGLLHHNRSGTLAALNQPVEARKHREQAIAIRQKLVEDFPDVVEHAFRLAETLENHGADQRWVLRKLDEAEKTFRRAVALMDKVVTKAPAERSYLSQRARSLDSLGLLLRAQKQVEEGEKALRAALVIREQLATANPRVAEYQSELGASLNNLAFLLYHNRQDYAEARRLLRQAVPRQQEAVKANPNHPTYVNYLLNHLGLLARAEAKLGQHAEIARLARDTRQRFPQLFNPYFWATLLAECVSLASKDAMLPADQREKLAVSYGDEAMKLLHAAAEKGNKNLAQLATDKTFDPLRQRDDFKAFLAKLAVKP